MGVEILMAIAALAPVVGDLIGQALGSGDKEEAERLARQAVSDFNIPVPEIERLASEMGGVQADPLAVEGQRMALADLQRFAQQGPEAVEFRGAVDAATAAANQQARGQNEALRQEMQARGMGGGGVEFATRALSNQQAANRAASGAFDAAAEGQRQARQALMAGADLAGDIRQQSFGEGSARARAADEMARFNEANKFRQFGARLERAQGLAGARQNVGNILTGNAAQVQQTGRNVGQGVGYGAAAVGQDMRDEKRWQEYLEMKRKERPS